MSLGNWLLKHPFLWVGLGFCAAFVATALASDAPFRESCSVDPVASWCRPAPPGGQSQLLPVSSHWSFCLPASWTSLQLLVFSLCLSMRAYVLRKIKISSLEGFGKGEEEDAGVRATVTLRVCSLSSLGSVATSVHSLLLVRMSVLEGRPLMNRTFAVTPGCSSSLLSPSHILSLGAPSSHQLLPLLWKFLLQTSEAEGFLWPFSSLFLLFSLC